MAPDASAASFASSSSRRASSGALLRRRSPRASAARQRRPGGSRPRAAAGPTLRARSCPRRGCPVRTTRSRDAGSRTTAAVFRRSLWPSRRRPGSRAATARSRRGRPDGRSQSRTRPSSRAARRRPRVPARGAAEELELARILLALGEKGRVEGHHRALAPAGPRLAQELPSGRFLASAEPVKSACSFRRSARSNGSSVSSRASFHRPCPRSTRVSSTPSKTSCRAAGSGISLWSRSNAARFPVSRRPMSLRPDLGRKRDGGIRLDEEVRH